MAAQDDLSPAIAALRKALECDADYLPAYTFLGLLLNRQQNYAESENILQRGLRRAPNAWDLHYQLAIALYGGGRYAQAEQEYVKTQSLNPAPPPELHAKLADIYLKESAYEKAFKEMQIYLALEPDGRFASRIRRIMHELESGGAARTPAQPAEPAPPKP